MSKIGAKRATGSLRSLRRLSSPTIPMPSSHTASTSKNRPPLDEKFNNRHRPTFRDLYSRSEQAARPAQSGKRRRRRSSLIEQEIAQREGIAGLFHGPDAADRRSSSAPVAGFFAASARYFHWRSARFLSTLRRAQS